MGRRPGPGCPPDRLRAEQYEHFRNEAWLKDPFKTDFEKLSLIEIGEGPLPDTQKLSWTALGRAVSFALKFGRHRRAIEKVDNGDDQEA